MTTHTHTMDRRHALAVLVDRAERHALNAEEAARLRALVDATLDDADELQAAVDTARALREQLARAREELDQARAELRSTRRELTMSENARDYLRRSRDQAAERAVRGVQGWMALDLHMALGLPADHGDKYQGRRSWGDWWADLLAEVRKQRDQLAYTRELLAEARQWARHGYEIGQRHNVWSDHGIAPRWLTLGGPEGFDSDEPIPYRTTDAADAAAEWQRRADQAGEQLARARREADDAQAMLAARTAQVLAAQRVADQLEAEAEHAPGYADAARRIRQAIDGVQWPGEGQQLTVAFQAWQRRVAEALRPAVERFVAALRSAAAVVDQEPEVAEVDRSVVDGPPAAEQAEQPAEQPDDPDQGEQPTTADTEQETSR